MSTITILLSLDGHEILVVTGVHNRPWHGCAHTLIYGRNYDGSAADYTHKTTFMDNKKKNTLEWRGIVLYFKKHVDGFF